MAKIVRCAQRSDGDFRQSLRPAYKSPMACQISTISYADDDDQICVTGLTVQARSIMDLLHIGKKIRL